MTETIRFQHRTCDNVINIRRRMSFDGCPENHAIRERKLSEMTLPIFVRRL